MNRGIIGGCAANWSAGHERRVSAWSCPTIWSAAAPGSTESAFTAKVHVPCPTDPAPMTDARSPEIPDEDDFRALLKEGVMLTPELAYEALDAMQALRIPELHYSIWLKLPDGEVVPSQVFDGASGASAGGIDATYSWTRLLIESDRLKHEKEPEAPDSIFLVYLTTHWLE